MRDEEQQRRVEERQIDRMRASIRKKHAALKTGIMEGEIALNKRFKPIVEPLKRIAENIERKARDDDDNEDTDESDKRGKTVKRKRDDNDDDDGLASNTISTPIPRTNKKRQRLNATSDIFSNVDFTEREEGEEVFGDRNDRQILGLHAGPLGQKYVDILLSGDRRNEIYHVYGVYFGDEGNMMLGDKRFEMKVTHGCQIAQVVSPQIYHEFSPNFPKDKCCRAGGGI